VAQAVLAEDSTTRATVFRLKRALDEQPDSGRTARAVARAKAGDSGAVDYLYTQYADNVYSYVLSIVQDGHTAEDVTQHVFAKVLTKLDRYEQRSVPFAAWLFRIARNAAIDHLRGDRMICCDEVRGADQPEHDTAERRRVLKEALGGLPSEQRRVMVLRHIYGLSPREIANDMSKSEGAVHTLHHRARRAMQRELQHHECAPALAPADRMTA
jgi:RNA polymerase sigma-70 factor (ECF subfamily)